MKAEDWSLDPARELSSATSYRSDHVTFERWFRLQNALGTSEEQLESSNTGRGRPNRRPFWARRLTSSHPTASRSYDHRSCKRGTHQLIWRDCFPYQGCSKLNLLKPVGDGHHDIKRAQEEDKVEVGVVVNGFLPLIVDHILTWTTFLLIVVLWRNDIQYIWV